MHESEQAVRDRIESTRARMGDTIEEIGARVNPDRVQRELKARARGEVDEIKATMKRKARSTMRDLEHGAEERGRGLWHSIKENPVPATMVGVGLAWMMANGDTDSRVSGRIRQAADEARETGAEAVDRVQDQAKDRVQEGMDAARERTSELTHRGRDQARQVRQRAVRAERRVEDSVRENPLAAGAMAAALGFAAGLMVPETQREHELMGDVRDRALDRARSSARDAADTARKKAREKVGEAAQRAVDETFPGDDRTQADAMTEPGRS